MKRRGFLQLLSLVGGLLFAPFKKLKADVPAPPVKVRKPKIKKWKQLTRLEVEWAGPRPSRITLGDMANFYSKPKSEQDRLNKILEEQLRYNSCGKRPNKKYNYE